MNSLQSNLNKQSPSPPVNQRHRTAMMKVIGPVNQQAAPEVAEAMQHQERTLYERTNQLDVYMAQIRAQQQPVVTKKESVAPLVRLVALWSMIGRALRSLFFKRVPILLQMSEVECGAASLAMILGYYGRKTSISEINERYGIGRDGLSALNIVKVARDYGLRVRAISLKNNDFTSVALPAIIHWEFNHFLIVERWSKHKVELADPAVGRRTLSGEEFDESFTGIVIILEPGDQFVRSSTPSPISFGTYISQYLKRAPFVLFQILGSSLLLQIFGLAVPILTKIVIDQVIPGKTFSLLQLLVIGMFLMLLSQLIMLLLRSSLLVFLQMRVDAALMVGFFEHLLSLPIGFFLKRSSGDLLSRFESNTIVQDTVSSQLISAVLDSGTVIIYLFILFTLSPAFGFVVVIVSVIQAIVTLGTNGRMSALTRRELEASGKTQGYMSEVLAGMTTLKSVGAEQRALVNWSNLFFDQLNASLRRTYFASIVGTVIGALQGIAPLLLLWIGATQVLNGSMELGMMLALTSLAGAFLSPVASLVSSGQQIQFVRSHLERIADVADAMPEQDIQRVQNPPILTGRIRLDNVGFRYDVNSDRVLKNINLTIEPGKKVAIVGRSGSGKSTLGKLLLGLYIPTEGEVVYDNIPLRYLNYQAVRSQFGVVMQNASVFSGSIRENIALNAPDLPLEQVIASAVLADLHNDIMKMPMGYETYVSEGGSGLSGGQNQRLSIARALVRRPAILLLDEATSALDVVTERRVERNLRTLPCTQIIIAHRLSTIRNADQILVMHEGSLVEQGTHEELLRHNGFYANLIQHQLASEEIRSN